MQDPQPLILHTTYVAAVSQNPAPLSIFIRRFVFSSYHTPAYRAIEGSAFYELTPRSTQTSFCLAKEREMRISLRIAVDTVLCPQIQLLQQSGTNIGIPARLAEAWILHVGCCDFRVVYLKRLHHD